MSRSLSALTLTFLWTWTNKSDLCVSVSPILVTGPNDSSAGSNERVLDEASTCEISNAYASPLPPTTYPLLKHRIKTKPIRNTPQIELQILVTTSFLSIERSSERPQDASCVYNQLIHLRTPPRLPPKLDKALTSCSWFAKERRSIAWMMQIDRSIDTPETTGPLRSKRQTRGREERSIASKTTNEDRETERQRERERDGRGGYDTIDYDREGKRCSGWVSCRGVDALRCEGV